MTKLFARKALGLILVVSLLLGAVPISRVVAQTATTIPVFVLEPSWTAPGGGGVFALYDGPPDYNWVSPGATAVFDGREAGIIKAGITPDPDSGNYEDQGLLSFKIDNLDISDFASQALTYEVQNETGSNPVWVRIRIAGTSTTYQHIPASYGVGGGYHSVDAGNGKWQLMDSNGNATGPLMTLAELAASNPSYKIDRVYLTLGMGNSYNVGPGVGTVAWVDKVVIGETTYDFTVHCTSDCYVNAATGDDSYPGTSAYPFKSLQKGIDEVEEGGTVHVAAGTYTDGVGGWVGGYPTWGYQVGGITLLLADGVVIANPTTSCFSITKSHTHILAESIGGAKCVPAGYDLDPNHYAHGIVFDPFFVNLDDIVLAGLEIDGTGTSSGSGLSAISRY